MGMINHRHNHLRIESQALLRLILLEGGPSLAAKAVETLRQLVRTRSTHPRRSDLEGVAAFLPLDGRFGLALRKSTGAGNAGLVGWMVH